MWLLGCTGIAICFSMPDAFRVEVFTAFMTQVVDLPVIPTLFLRTVWLCSFDTSLPTSKLTSSLSSGNSSCGDLQTSTTFRRYNPFNAINRERSLDNSTIMGRIRAISQSNSPKFV